MEDDEKRPTAVPDLSELEEDILRFHSLVSVKVRKKFICRPTFIGVGAGRCGTSSIYHALRQHPDIHMSPIKEVNYFGIWDKSANPNGLTFSEYTNYFLGAEENQLIGEISPVYLTYPNSMKRLKEALPEAKIIVTVRPHIDRMLSQFKHHCDGHGYRAADSYFAEAIKQFREGFPNDQHWYVPVKSLYRSLYCPGIEFLMENYPSSNIFISDYDRLKASFKSQLRAIQEFLGVPKREVEEVVASRSTDDDFELELSEGVRASLQEIVEPDARRLKELTGIDYTGA